MKVYKAPNGAYVWEVAPVVEDNPMVARLDDGETVLWLGQTHNDEFGREPYRSLRAITLSGIVGWVRDRYLEEVPC